MTDPTLDQLSQEQKSIMLDHVDYEFVWSLGSALRQAAHEQNHPVAIEIRIGRDVVFSTLLPGATVDNLSWTRRKSGVAYRFQKSSLAVRIETEAKGFDLNAVFNLPHEDFVASGGSVPLQLKSGLVVGTVTVSGLPDVQDHQLIVDVLKTLIA